jgi:hypothetical protein
MEYELEMDLFTTFTHHSELQVITAISLIPKTPVKPFSSLLFFISRSLATDFNIGNPSASRAQVLYSDSPVRCSTLH